MITITKTIVSNVLFDACKAITSFTICPLGLKACFDPFYPAVLKSML